MRPFGIDSFAVGDQIEVRGFETADGIHATSIEREDDEGDADVELAGFVSGVNDPMFGIAGIEIASDGSTEFDDIDRAEFFSQGEGWRVEVEAFFSGGMLVAEEIERDETNGGDVDED